MTVSNSKLDQYENDQRKIIKAEFKKDGGHVVNDGVTTIAYLQVSANLVEFATSICSPDEQKFRRKVGEFYALERFEVGYTVKMRLFEFRAMMYDVYGFSCPAHDEMAFFME